MANTIKIKSGSGTPTTSDIQDKELAFDRSADKLYINDAGTIVDLTGSGATGDIEGVTAGNGLTGGGTSGTVTLNVDDVFLKNNADDTTSGTITAAGFTTSGSVTSDTLVGNSNNTNTLLFDDDQSGASNMVTLQSINHINVMTDGNNNGTGNFRVYNGSYDTDTADLAFAVNSNSNATFYGDVTLSGTGDLTVPGVIKHTGDSDTYIFFTNDRIRLYAGNTLKLDTDETYLTTAGTGIDISSATVSVDVSDFMTNGSNDRILTATGTDAMNAESNLTFNGTTLGITGSLTASGNATISGTASVTSSITTNYGVAFTNGNTNFLFYNNTGDDLFYLRDTTNGQMLQTWTTTSSTIHKNLVVDGGLLTVDDNGDANEGGEIAINPGTSHTCVWRIDSFHGHLRFFGSDTSGEQMALTNTGDLSILTGTKFSLDGRGGHTYIQEESDGNVVFYADNRQMLRLHEGNGEVVVNDPGLDTNFRVEGDTNTNLLFTDAGNDRVGIGTNTPGALFTVRKDGTQASSVSTTYQIQTVSDSNGGMAIQAGGTSSAYLVFGDNANYDAGRIQYNNSNNQMNFWTADTKHMSITSGGNVGIGVDSPSALLHLNEDDNVGAFLVQGGGGGTYLGRFQRDVGGSAYVDIHCGSDDPQITFTDSGASRQYSIGADSSFNGFKIAENSSIGTNDRFGINDAGQVLVGTSISNRSSVAGYSPIFQTEAAGAAGYVQIVDSENGQFHGGSLALHKYRSGGIVANTELGSIWFGGTDSANSTFAQGALIRAYAEGADSGSNVATNVRFFTNTGSAVTEAMRIESDQDVHFDQDVIAFSTTPSDKRLKTNINDINYGLDAVMKLSPKEYDWKKDNRHDIGFIAQEVEEVIPEIVKDKKHFDKDIKTLDYEKLTAVLIKAVQEQQQQINELKEKLNG